MGKASTKFRRTRQKLQWYFEQRSTDDTGCIPLDDIATGGMHAGMVNCKAGKRLETVKIEKVLLALLDKSGLPVDGRRLRLTKRMMDHVIQEFTNRAAAVEILYGKAADEKKAGHLADYYRQALNIALARIEAAFLAVGLLSDFCSIRESQEDYQRNEQGYLIQGKKGGKKF